MAEVVTPVEKKVAGTASPTLATAITNYNTAMATAVTTAQGVANVSAPSIKIVPGNLIFDATNYVVSGSVLYNVVVSS